MLLQCDHLLLECHYLRLHGCDLLLRLHEHAALRFDLLLHNGLHLMHVQELLFLSARCRHCVLQLLSSFRWCWSRRRGFVRRGFGCHCEGC